MLYSFFMSSQALVESLYIINSCNGNNVVSRTTGIQKGATVCGIYHDCIHSWTRITTLYHFSTSIETGISILYNYDKGCGLGVVSINIQALPSHTLYDKLYGTWCTCDRSSYKPHPLMIRLRQKLQLPNCTFSHEHLPLIINQGWACHIILFILLTIM